MMKSSVVCISVVVVISTFFSGSLAFLDTKPDNVVKFKATSVGQGQGEAWCELCELIMDRVKVLIKEKDNEGKVNSTLYGLCDIVKGVMRQQCYSMIPLIKMQLTQGFDSHEACLMLQFCGTGKAGQILTELMGKMGQGASVWNELTPIFHSLHPHIKQWMSQYGLAKAQAGFSVTCMLCRTAVGTVDKSLEQYKQPLTDYVVGICNDLPAPTNKACSDAMSFYIPSWWDAFFSKIASPDQICLDFGMCKEPINPTSP